MPRRNGKVSLVLNYFSFVLSGYIWSKVTKRRADVVFIYGLSPITSALPGIWYGKKWKLPTFLYVLDLWPESMQIVGGIQNKHIVKKMNGLVDYIYRNVDSILTSSQSFIQKIQKRGIDQDKLVFWPQYAEDYYSPLMTPSENEITLGSRINITFAGNIGEAQGLGILPAVALELESLNVPIIFNIIGEGRYKNTLLQEIGKLGVDKNFNFISQKKPEEIPSYFANSDASLIILAQNELFDLTIPAKLQSTMACGIPIIASLNGEAGQIVLESQSGLVSGAGDVKGLVENILQFSKLPLSEKKRFAKNALQYSKNYYDRDRLLDQLEQLISRE